jgi:hypothetical protein
MTQLSWTKVDNYALRSECGEWTICKVIVLGEVWFELRKRVPRPATDADVWAKAKHFSGEHHGRFKTTMEAKAKANGTPLDKLELVPMEEA